jgi:hypothetical protein
MFTDQDLARFPKGLTSEQIQQQLKRFETGFPFLELEQSASTEKGIIIVDNKTEDELLNNWNAYLSEGNNVLKFVPASGAASRMFKDLFEFLESKEQEPLSGFMNTFFEGIHRFAFSDELNEACLHNEGKNIDVLIAEGFHKIVVENLLNQKGLNYGSLPKGMLRFHSYPEGNRKAAVEHLVEGALYAAANGAVQVHFTVSSEHLALFEKEMQTAIPEVEKAYKVSISVSFSEQKPNTDTVAADENNQPFRDNGQIIFRPGGHGALLENLNDLDGDVVFIKNIDNVVPDRIKTSTVRYKKLLAGLLVTLQKKTFNYLKILDSGQYDRKILLEIIRFLQQELFTRNPETKLLEDSDLALYLKRKLNRPIRVCGMVLNEGEPGGGPFWAKNPDGTFSLQILESSQIDLNDPIKKEMFERGTHFNPVDLVCTLKNYKGEKFNLPDYVDPNTGFISSKSKSGKKLKALELPGLWNGAMSDWNTIFVEVPIETFNPVKTVNDLLRPQHQ